MTRHRIAAVVVGLAVAVPGVAAIRSQAQPAQQVAEWACIGFDNPPGGGVCIDSPYDSPTYQRTKAFILETRRKVPLP